MRCICCVYCHLGFTKCYNCVINDYTVKTNTLYDNNLLVLQYKKQLEPLAVPDITKSWGGGGGGGDMLYILYVD